MTLRGHWMMRGIGIAIALAALVWRFTTPAVTGEQVETAPQPSLTIARFPAPVSDTPFAPIFARPDVSETGGIETDTGLSLIGVAGRLPDDVQVLLRLPDGRTATLSPGGKVEDWTLLSVAADRVVLTRDGQQVILNIAQ